MQQSSHDVWTGSPPRDMFPVGIFADSLFGEPSGDAQEHGGGSFPSADRSEPGGTSAEYPSPSSPVSQRSDDDAAGRTMGTAALHPHLFHITCYLNDEIAKLLPVPASCPKTAPVAEGEPAPAPIYECAEDVDPATHEPHQCMSPGRYHGVLLSSSGIDIVLVLPVTAVNDDGGDSPDDAAAVEVIGARFKAELATLAREINSLASHMARSDAMPREVEPFTSSSSPSTNGTTNSHSTSSGSGSPGALHVDPMSGASRLIDGLVSTSGSMVSKEVATTAPLCLVHDLALGVGEFLDGALGTQDDTPHNQRVVPSALLLNRANVFLKECRVVTQLLGTPLRLPRRHPDDTHHVDVPFATECTTRVILGRSALSDRDRKGPHNVLFARMSGGQQVFYGSAAQNSTTTLRTVEEHVAQFVAASRSHTVVM